MRRWIWACCILLVLGVAGLIGLRFLTRRRPPRDRVACYRGSLALRAGHPVKAAHSFRAALRLNPKNLSARVGLVRALGLRKEFTEAFAEIEQAGEAGLPETQAVDLRARIHALRAKHRIESAGHSAKPATCDAIVREDLDPAIELVETHADDYEKPAAAYTLLGDLYAEKTRLLYMKRQLLSVEREQAREIQASDRTAAAGAEMRALGPAIRASQREYVRAYMRAIQLDPAAADPRLALARHALSTYIPRPEQAKVALEPLLECQPPNRDALRLQAMAERYAGDAPRALERIRGLRAETPEDVSLMLSEVETLLAMGYWDEAAPLSETILTLQPTNLLGLYLRGRVLLHEDRPNEAANTLQTIFIDTDRRWPQARLALARALHGQGNHEQALSAFRKVIADAAATAGFNIKVQAEMREARYEASLALARELLTRSAESAAQYARNALLTFPERAEALARAKTAYTAAGLTAEIPSLIVLHATAVATSQGPDAGLVICRKEAAEFAGNRSLRLLTARLLVRKGDYRDAETIFTELYREYPDKLSYAHELAGLHLLLGRDGDAQALYEELLRSHPDDIHALDGLIGLLVRKGETARALTVLKRGDPTLSSGRTLSKLVGLYLGDNQPDEAIELAAAQARASSDSARDHTVLAEVLWRHGRLADARSAFETALKLDLAYAPAYRLGLLDLEENKADDAVDRFQEACKRFPEHLGSRMYLAVALRAAGRTAEALDILRELRSRTAGTRGSAEGLRWLMAVAYADRSRSADPDLSPHKENRQMIEQFERVIRDYPNLMLARLALADSLSRRGDIPAAVRTLEDALDIASPSQAPLLHLRLARLFQKQGRVDSAIASFWAAMDHPTAGPEACNNVAWMLAVDKKNPAEALPYAVRAVKLAPTNPSVLDTAGWIYYCSVPNTSLHLAILDKMRSTGALQTKGLGSALWVSMNSMMASMS